MNNLATILVLFSVLVTFNFCSNNNRQDLSNKDSTIARIQPEYYYNDSVPAIINDSTLNTPWLYNYFANLNWKEHLNKNDVSACLIGIDSTRRHSEFHPNPIMPLLVHCDYAVLNKGSLWRWDAYRKYFLKTQNFSDQMFDQFLLNAIDPAKLEVILKVHVKHYSSIDDKLLDVLVIRQCKLLRKGLPANINLILVPHPRYKTIQIRLRIHQYISRFAAISRTYNTHSFKLVHDPSGTIVSKF